MLIADGGLLLLNGLLCLCCIGSATPNNSARTYFALHILHMQFYGITHRLRNKRERALWAMQVTSLPTLNSFVVWFKTSNVKLQRVRDNK